VAEPRAGPAGRSGELARRVLSSLVLIPLALAVTWWGGLAFAVAVIVLAVGSFWEWTRIAAAGAPAWSFPAGAGALVAGLLALHLERPAWAALLIGAAAVAMLGLGLGEAALRWTGLGLLYAGLPSAAIVLLRGGEDGVVAILFLFAVVWGGDTAAYFGGRRIGGPLLWPRISPKKTWSGAVAGLTCSAVAGLAVAAVAGAGPLLVAALVATLLSVAGQAGDLLESAVKRRFAVKDSGALIPGHGGLLDRLDALYAAALLAGLLAGAGIGGPLPDLAGAA
jgi:phosphatidate cytidylyltransferase